MIYRLFGEHTLPVAIAQAFVFALICLIVYAIARRVAGERTATRGRGHDGAVPAAALLRRARPDRSVDDLRVDGWRCSCVCAPIQHGSVRAISCSPACCSALTTIVRPAFVLLPFGLAIAMPLLVPSERNCAAPANGPRLPSSRRITMVPWFTYNYVYLGRFTLSPAGGIGRGLWEGSWQGRWSGRLHNDLTHTAEQAISRDELDARVRAIAAEAGLAPDGMLDLRARVAGHSKNLGDADRPDGARPRPRRGGPGILASRHRAHPRRHPRMDRAARDASRVHSVGVRHSDPLHRHQRHAAAGGSADLAPASRAAGHCCSGHRDVAAAAAGLPRPRC